MVVFSLDEPSRPEAPLGPTVRLDPYIVGLICNTVDANTNTYANASLPGLDKIARPTVVVASIAPCSALELNIYIYIYIYILPHLSHIINSHFVI